MSIFMSARQKQYLDKIESLYADKLGNSFISDQKARRILVRGVADFHENQYESCLARLAQLGTRCKVPKDRQVILFFSAACHKGLGRLDQAIACYEDVLRITPGYSSALSNLSLIYIDLGQYEQALPYARRAVECDPKNPYAAHNLASIQFNVFERAKAKKSAMDALKLMPQFKQPAALLALIYAVENNDSKEEYFTKMAIGLGQNESDLIASKQYYKELYEKHDDIENALDWWKKQTHLPSFHMDYKEDSESLVGLDENGTFIWARIRCSDLPGPSLLPEKGMLSIGIRNDEANVSFTFDETAHVPKASQIFPAGFVRTEEWMPFANVQYDPMIKRLMEENIHIMPGIVQEKDFVDSLSQSGHGNKVLGYPAFETFDPREGSGLQKYDTLLFQWDRKQKYYVLIERDRLKNLDFSDVLLLIE